MTEIRHEARGEGSDSRCDAGKGAKPQAAQVAGRSVLATLWEFGDPRAPVSLFWLIVAVLLGCQMLRPVHDVDIFWQLKLGDLTLDHGLPAHEPFLAGRQAEPLSVVGWLGQAVFALTRRIGGWPLLRLFDTAMWLGGFVVVAWHAGRRAGNWLPASAALAAGWFAAIAFASIRPQSFAVLSFGLMIVLVRSSWPVWGKVLLGTGLFVLWQNLHPSVSVAAVYLAAAAAGEWGKWLIAGGQRPTLTRAILAMIAVAAIFATPAGAGILAITAANQARCSSALLQVGEWLPIWHNFPATGRLVAAAMLTSVATIVITTTAVRGRSRLSMVDFVPAVVLTLLMLFVFRFVLFWGMAIIPVVVRSLTRPDDVKPLGMSWRARGLAAVILAFIAVLPTVGLGAHFSDYYPFAGIRAMKAAGVQGTIYCNAVWGGVLIDSGYPEWQVTHDGRYYLYSQAELDRAAAAARGEVPLSELESRYQPVAFLLWPGPDDPLIARLGDAPGWQQLQKDANSVVFVRR